MTQSRRQVVALAVSSLIVAAGISPAWAQAPAYPNRPITIIVSFPPGASTDAAARIPQDAMSEALGQPIVIDNRAGAGGTTGTALAAAAPPDGYTFLVTVNPPLTMNMYMQKNFPYDPKKALAPVALIATSLLALAVNSSVPATNVPELIAYVKRNPGKVSFGSAGVGSGHHIAGALMNKNAGIDMVHVPYRGSGPAIQDLVAGQIQVSFGTTPAVLPHQQSGAIRMLAFAEEKRSPDFPDVPTIAETIPGVVTNTWVGLFAPGGTPRPIIDKVAQAMNAAMARPEIIAKFKAQGLTPAKATPEEISAMIDKELAHWAAVIPSIGIQPE